MATKTDVRSSGRTETTADGGGGSSAANATDNGTEGDPVRNRSVGGRTNGRRAAAAAATAAGTTDGSVPTPETGRGGMEGMIIDEVPAGNGTGHNRPEPRFAVAQKVLCRDTDGIVYQALIRRRLYGKHYHKQAHVGQADTEEEIDSIRMSGLVPTWHYFVHFLKWKPNWDRWVGEDDVMEINDDNLEWMHLLGKAHRSLQREFRQRGRGASTSAKKGRCPIDGGDFLRAWRKRLDQMERDRARGKKIDVSDPFLPVLASLERNAIVAKAESEAVQTKRRLQRSREQNRRWLEREAKLREQDLGQSNERDWVKSDSRDRTWTKKKRATDVDDDSGANVGGDIVISADAISIPFSLRKCLVEEWEVICQCGMLPRLPCPVTVSDALELYLRSKGVFRETRADGNIRTDNRFVPADGKRPTDDSNHGHVAENTIAMARALAVTEGPGDASFDVSLEDGRWYASLRFRTGQSVSVGTYGTRQEGVWACEMVKERSRIAPARPSQITAGNASRNGRDLSLKTTDSSVAAADSPKARGRAKRRSKSNKSSSESAAKHRLKLKGKARGRSAVGKVATDNNVDADTGDHGHVNDNDNDSDDRCSDDRFHRNERELAAKNKEWTDMVDGIAMFFEEALPFRLLYRQEFPQHRVIEDDEELSALPKVQVYGCEHLLRLFLRLPAIMNDHYSRRKASLEEAEDSKRIVARVNDLIRFLQKHQDILFCGLYRKMNDAEGKELLKMERVQERLKKRRLEEAVVDSHTGTGGDGDGDDAGGTRVKRKRAR